MKCVVTQKSVIDDCSIRIEFGYGSNRDLQTFEFNPISDELGEEILQFIKSKLNTSKRLEDLNKDDLSRYNDWRYRPGVND